MAKETVTLFNGPAASGLNALADIDLNAYESAVFYFVLSSKPVGTVTYNLFAHELTTNTYTSVAGSPVTADGTYRTEIPHLYDRSYQLEFYVPGSGATVVAVIVLDDGE